MWETCAVDLRVRLPRPIADEVEEVQRRDPEMLSRILAYAMTRRTIFDHLAAQPASGFSSTAPEAGLDGFEGTVLR
jgi:hypothetical protein